MRSRNLLLATMATFVVAALAVPLAAAGAGPKVVASIKPVHALVAGVMQGVGAPDLLIKSAGTPHSYSLRPSEARALSQADLLVWVGPELETFLERPIHGLVEKAKVLELGALDGLTLLETREGGAWEHDDHEGEAHGGEREAQGHDAQDHDDVEHGEEDHEHDDDEHGQEAHDMHLWLDPDNAIAIVDALVASLSAVDPAQAGHYAENGKVLAAEIRATDAALQAALAPVRDLPYVVFHDAYHYLESHYRLAAVGSITVSPDRAPGAKRLREIRAKIADLGAVCVFSEPQFEPALVDTVIDGTAARTGVLDPLGADVEAGAGAYRAILHGLAAGLTACLKPGS